MIDQEQEQIEVLANGRIVDKRTVEDPTVKFIRTRFTRTSRNRETSRRNVDFVKPEYDLPTIANAAQMDGYLRRTINIFKEQVLKNGFETNSKTDKIVRHVRRRLTEIQRLTGVTFYDVITQVIEQLVTYGNAYLIKVRSGVKSNFGRNYRLYGKNMNPIVGLFLADATTIEIGLNPQSRVVQYKQVIRGQELFWDERDVIHFTYNKIPGTVAGMSPMVSILDDIRALRKLEEEIEILGFQYAVPLYLYKVGNKDIPPAPGEIEDTSNRINNMPSYGMLVVPGHHDVEVPSNNTTPVDIMEFVTHFKLRVFAGLGVSPVAMGEVASSNRNTSEVLDLMMQSQTKSYQAIIKNKIEMELFRELLLDGGFNGIDQLVELKFPEIDIENQIKIENNVIQKWQNNVIDRDEARLEMDYDKKLNPENTYLELVELPKIREEREIQLQAAKLNKTTSSSSSKSSNSNSKKKATENKVRPENQYGKSTGRPKYVKNSIDIIINENEILSKDLLLDTNGFYLGKENYSEKLIRLSNRNLRRYVDDNIRYISNKYQLDADDFDTELIDEYISSVNILVENKINRSLLKMNNDFKVLLFKDEIEQFYRLQEKKIENLSKIVMYKSLGFKSILFNVDSCNLHSKKNILIDKINYRTIPPLSYGCECTVEEEKLNEFICTK